MILQTTDLRLLPSPRGVLRALGILAALFLSQVSIVQAASYFVSGTTGNDAWTGLLASPNVTASDGPFRTLARAQSAMRASSVNKTVTIRGGTYSLAGSALLFTSQDANEIWIPYTNENVVIDGAGSGYVQANGASNLRIEGLTFQNLVNSANTGGFYLGGSGYSIRWNTFKNSTLTCISGSSVQNALIDSNTMDGQSPGNPPGSTANAYAAIQFWYGSSGNRITRNLIKNAQGGGIQIAAGATDPAINNNIIDRNILRNIGTSVVDMGALYIIDRTRLSIGNQITNNIVDGFGGYTTASTVFKDNWTKAIYLDDGASHVLVSGNLCRGCGDYAVQYHGGNDNTVTNNIFDLSLGGSELGFYQTLSYSGGMVNNKFTNNIIYSAGAFHNPLWNVIKNASDAPVINSTNLYYSATSAAIPNSVAVDTNPIYTNPLFASPSTGDYSMPSNSPAYTQIGFQALVTDQGPLPNPYISTSGIAPTVATPSAAGANPVTGTTVNLSVLGADDGGEANLTYTWSTTGTPPAAVSFSANASNAAKNTVATFTKAGAYSFQVTIRDAGGLTVTSSLGLTVNAALTSVVVSPVSASIAVGATQSFTASARDQFGTALATQPVFTWTVSGGGTISSGGLFTATTAGGPFTVTATGSGKSGTASVTVTATAAAGPVGFWKFDETSGTTAADSSGNGNAGTLSGGATWTAGASGNAILFDGVSGAVSIPASTRYDSTAFTLSFWIKPIAVRAGDRWSNLVMAREVYQSRGFRLGLNSDRTITLWTTESGGTVTLTSLAALPLNAFSLVTFTYDGSVARVSINGTTNASASGLCAPATGVVLTVNGGVGGTQPSNSAMDDLRWYNRVLSSSEITALATPTQNTAPTVATPSAAGANPVTGTTVNLSVLGADDGGEANLIYTWATTGTPPSAVSFSANATNAAKNTVATFTKAGAYSFQVTIRDAGGLTVTSSLGLTVNATLTSVVVSPVSASIAVGATQSFTASARDQFGTTLATQPVFTWTVSGGGTISSGGLFTATTAGGPFTVTASGGGKSGTAAITVTTAASSGPVGYWTFNEGSGTTAADSSGNGNSGTLTTGASWTAGASGTAVLFDGVAGAVTIPASSRYDTTAFSVSFWIKPLSLRTGDRWSNIVMGHETYATKGFRMGLNTNGTVTLWTTESGGNLTATSLASLPLNAFSLVTLTYNGSAATFYVNGSASGSATGTHVPASGVAISLNGGVGGAQTSNSAIDDLRWYNRVLSSAEIAALYSVLPPAPTDTTPPVISGIQATNTTSSQSTILWTTDEGSDSQVDYGFDTTYPYSSALNSTLVTAHSVTLTGLTNRKTYHYRVKSRDQFGNMRSSGDMTFYTPKPGAGR